MSANAAPAADVPQSIAVTGATGLVGSALVRALRADGRRGLRVTRSPREPGDVGWDPAAGTIDREALRGIDAAVHLAGESVAGLWTEERKRRIRDSRVRGTRLLAETLAALEPRPRVLVSASASGIYGDRGDEVLTEESPPGEGFLAEVAREWEAATAPASEAGIRVARLRFGIVVSADGGALTAMLPPFRLGVGGPLGDGRQWMPWVALDDVVAAIRFALDRPEVHGPVNVAAPEPVRNEEFARTLGEVLGRPTPFAVPGFLLRLLPGGMAEEALLASERLAPRRLEAWGFHFTRPTLRGALEAELGKG